MDSCYQDTESESNCTRQDKKLKKRKFTKKRLIRLEARVDKIEVKIKSDHLKMVVTENEKRILAEKLELVKKKMEKVDELEVHKQIVEEKLSTDEMKIAEFEYLYRKVEELEAEKKFLEEKIKTDEVEFEHLRRKLEELEAEKAELKAELMMDDIKIEDLEAKNKGLKKVLEVKNKLEVEREKNINLIHKLAIKQFDQLETRMKKVEEERNELLNFIIINRNKLD